MTLREIAERLGEAERELRKIHPERLTAADAITLRRLLLEQTQSFKAFLERNSEAETAK